MGPIPVGGSQVFSKKILTFISSLLSINFFVYPFHITNSGLGSLRFRAP